MNFLWSLQTVFDERCFIRYTVPYHHDYRKVMSMKKRVLTFLLAIAVLLILLPTAFAETGSAEFTTDTIESVIGNTVSMRVYVKLNASDGQLLNTWRATVSYDPEALTYVGFALRDDDTRTDSVSGTDSLWGVNASEPGVLEIAFSNAFGCKEDGYLVTLSFRTQQTGSYAIDLKNVVYSTYRESDGGVVSYSLADSTLTTLTVLETMPTDSPTPDPTETPTPTPTPDPTETPTPTPTSKPTATPDEDDEEDEDPEPTRKPTATPTRKPRQTPTVQPTASPTASPTATPMPTPVPTPVPTSAPTGTPTAAVTVPPTEAPRTGTLITDGEGGCSNCSNTSLGILILDIGIGFLALQMVIVVLIILRKRKIPKNDFLDDEDSESDSDDSSDDDLDFTE